MRQKIKGETYKRLHRLVSNITPLAIWDSMVAGDNLDYTRKEIPDEFIADFDSIRAILESERDATLDKISVALEHTKDLTDKELGLMIQGGSLGPESAYLFNVRKRGWDWLKSEKGLKALHMPFRPTGNRLTGYTPTNSMNRFAEES